MIELYVSTENVLVTSKDLVELLAVNDVECQITEKGFISKYLIYRFFYLRKRFGKYLNTF